MEGSAGDEGKFGYRIEARSDGRTQLREPGSIEEVFRRPAGFYIAIGFFAGIFWIVIALSKHSGFGTISGLIFAGSWLACLVGPQIVLDRGWHIRKGEITRYWRLRGFRISRKWPHEISELQIRYDVWTHDRGSTHSLIGTESVGEITLLKYHHDENPLSKTSSSPLQDRIAPEVWWLGHEIAKISGLPLKTREGIIRDPYWWTEG